MNSNGFIDLLKMNLLFSSQDKSNNIFSTILTFIAIILISNNVLLDNINKISIKHTLSSIFMRENKIYIEGKRCFINGQFSRRHENIFSMSFYAVWKHVGDLLNTSSDIYSIRECSNQSSNYDDYGVDVSILSLSEDIAYVVEQKKPFKLNDTIWCTVNIKKEDLENNNSRTNIKLENIEIKLFSYIDSVYKLKEFVKNITNNYINSLQESRYGKTYIYTYEGIKSDTQLEIWSEYEFQTTTSFDNIFFKQKNYLLEKIDFFINNKKWYEHHGKPYTLGIGLSGPPGTGKTSIVKSIAKKLNRHLIVIPLNKISTTKEFAKVFFENKYIKANKKNPIDFSKKIIVFEDIDCMSNIVFSREDESSACNASNSSNNSSANEFGLISSVIKACKDDDFTTLDKKYSSIATDDKLTLSFILNIIDGIRETPGRIIIITSNYYDKLDKALIRPGRIDASLEMEYASRDIIKEMFNHFYSFNDYCDFDETLKSMNVEFKKVPDKKISQAKIVELYHSDPKQFINNILLQ
jgi:hypothetical protein|tara:strand:+ start:141 stop:1709 length:1569 start_codon:yes stop_codon:yes gene_type:complete